MVHHYIEDITGRKPINNFKWFDEGVACHLSSLLFEPEIIEGKKKWLKEEAKGDYLSLSKICSAEETFKLFVDPKMNKIFYNQVEFMAEYFFKEFTINDFNKLLQAIKAKPIDEAFQEALGITQEEFYHDWLADFTQ